MRSYCDYIIWVGILREQTDKITLMELPPSDLSWFADTLVSTLREIINAWDETGSHAPSDETSPELIREALAQLIEVLRLHEWNTVSAAKESVLTEEEIDISELADYGLTLLLELSTMATDLGLEPQVNQLDQLALSLSLWVVRQDGELSSLELVVNGLARIANHLSDPFELERLFFLMSEIVDALSPILLEMDTEPEQLHPWQLLMLNRAIVATRSHLTQLMETAFADVVERMPDEAPAFFQEGLAQVEIQDYPEPVREVIERYARECPISRTLH